MEKIQILAFRPNSRTYIDRCNFNVCSELDYELQLWLNDLQGSYWGGTWNTTCLKIHGDSKIFGLNYDGCKALREHVQKHITKPAEEPK